MARRTYSLHPQRLQLGEGYVPCEPHRASRIVIVETTSVPGKHGRRPYHTKRTVSVFSGAGAMLRARLELDGLIGRSTARTERRAAWGRSCTSEEYNRIIEESRRG